MIQQKHTIYLGGVTVSVKLKKSEEIELFNHLVKQIDEVVNKSKKSQPETDALNLEDIESWADIVDKDEEELAMKKTVSCDAPKQASKKTRQRKARRAKQRKAEMDAKIADAIAEKKAEMKAEMEAARAETGEDFNKVLPRKTRNGGHVRARNQCAFGKGCRNEECDRIHPLSDKWDKSTCIYGVTCHHWQLWWHTRDKNDMCPYDHSFHSNFKGFVPPPSSS